MLQIIARLAHDALFVVYDKNKFVHEFVCIMSGGWETRRQGDKETRRRGDKETLPLPPSPPLA